MSENPIIKLVHVPFPKKYGVSSLHDIDYTPQWKRAGSNTLSELQKAWFEEDNLYELRHRGPELITGLAQAIGKKYSEDDISDGGLKQYPCGGIKKVKGILERVTKVGYSIPYFIPTGDIERVVRELKDIKGHLINFGSACGYGPLYVATHLPSVNIDGLDGDVCGLFIAERLKRNPLILAVYELFIDLDEVEGKVSSEDKPKVVMKVLGDVLDASRPYLRRHQVDSNDVDLFKDALEKVAQYHNLSVEDRARLRLERDRDLLNINLVRGMLNSGKRVRFYLGLGEAPNIVIDIDGNVRELSKGDYDGGWDLEF